MNNLKKVLAVAGASALLAVTATACGAAANAATCQEAIKAFNDFSPKITAAAGDLEGFNKAMAGFGNDLAELAGKADGDVKSSLTKMAESFKNYKIDASDPAAATAKLPELVSEINGATQELATACS
ncbi:hypothetical protein [Sphaerimonospora mesophila]|uniref:hypothetical protein n=1 Tax=Sphaerimonospora mesophila TaxID=37483 RepID=UPI0006E1F50D